jgi:predicted Zn-dependent peptidase
MTDLQVHAQRLPCGLTLVHVEHPASSIARVSIRFRAGFFEEDTNEIGFLHVMEHMLAAWTSGRHPDTEENREAMAALGVSSNASTASHMTSFYVEGLTEVLPQMLDYFLPAFSDPKFDWRVFVREKNVVLQEYQSIMNGEWHVFDNIFSQIIHNSTSLAHTTDDMYNNLANCSPQNLTATHRKFLRADRAVLCCVGGDCEVFMKTAASEFRAHPERTASIPRFSGGPKSLHGIHKVFVQHDLGDAYQVRVVYKTPIDVFDDRAVALQVLDSLLTEGLTSRLYKKLRDELGAVYGVHGSLDMDPRNAKMSQYIISADTTEKHVSIVIDTIHETLRDLAASGFDADELALFKAIRRHSFASEDLSQLPETYEDLYVPFFIWNRTFQTRKRHRELVFAVSLEDVQAALRWMLEQSTVVFFCGKQDMWEAPRVPGDKPRQRPTALPRRQNQNTGNVRRSKA